MIKYLQYKVKKSRFTAWITVFILLLIFIPVLLTSSFVLLAKILGITLVVLVSIALWIWRTQSVRGLVKTSRIRMTINEKFWLDHHIPFYHDLSKSEQRIFEDRIGLFLAEIKITQIGKEVPEKEVCLYVSSSAIIAFWGLPY